MLFDVIGEMIGKLIGDSFKNRSQLGLIVAALISLLCFAIATVLILNGKYVISFICIFLGLLPIYYWKKQKK